MNAVTNPEDSFTFTLENISEAASYLLSVAKTHRILAFDGQMGAGKTTLIAEMCRQLGASDDFGSPTFSIVNEYLDATGNPIYHFDLYRINSPGEALDIGIEDYFYSDALCLLEWPQNIQELLPQDVVTVRIIVNPDGSRTIKPEYENN